MKLAVLTPSFNYGQYLSACLDSVAQQETLFQVKHVVQDGGSDDDSVAVLKERSEPRLRWSTGPDGGQSDGLNIALAASGSPDWIGWLNADEFYLPGTLELIRRIAEASPQADVIYGEQVNVGFDGNIQRLVPEHRYSRRILQGYGCYMGTCVTFIRRSVLGSAPWDTRYRRYMDWDLWLELDQKGARFLHVPEPLAAFRVHSDQVTAAPIALLDPERQQIRGERCLHTSGLGVRTAALTGRAAHLAFKAADRAYVRQIDFKRRFSGRPLEWFDPKSQGAQTARDIQAWADKRRISAVANFD